MPFKQAFGSAALPAAGVSAIAIAAAIGYVIYAAAPRDAETVAEAPPIVAQTTEKVIKSKPAASIAPVLDSAERVVPPVVPSASQTEVEAASEQNTIPPEVNAEAAIATPPVSIEPSTETETETETETSTTAQAFDPPEQKDVEDIAQTTTAPEINTPIESAPALSTPTVDIVRIPPEGISTVAGHADADVDILIFVDGIEVSRAKTGTSGDYVALFDIPAVDHPREMQVAAQDGETRIFASSSIVIAPFKAVRASEPVETAQIDVATNAETDVADVEIDKPQALVEAPSANVAAEKVTPVAPTVMVADDTGVKILQTAAPLQGISIDAITYDPDGAVFASGRGTSGATVRLYLNNAALMDISVGDDGQWRAKMDVAAGIYSLRADMVDETGKVLNRVEIPFKREDVAVLERLAQDAAQAETDLRSDAQSDSIETGNRGDEAQSTRSDTATQDAPQPRIASITVQPGNTLWGIASETYGDGFLFARVFNANVAQIRDPDLIYPGQVFVLPKD
jgi:hypothetical protein